MKDFYMVIYLVKQLMPGDEEALKQHLIKDYVYFHAFRNPAKVFSTYKAASDFFLKHSQECGFHYALNEPPYFLFMAIEKFTFLSDEKDLKNLISNNDIYHLQRLSNFVRIERSTGFKVLNINRSFIQMFTKFRNPYTEDKVFDIQKGFNNILHDICELNEIPDTISEICETVIADIGKQTSFTDSIINAHNAFNDREYTAMLNREYHLQEIQRANRVISLVAEGLSFDYSVFAVIRGKDGSYKMFETPCLKLDKLCETFNHNVSKACTIQIFFEQHRKDYFRNVEKENFSLFWTLTETESLTSPIRSFTGYQIEIASTF